MKAVRYLRGRMLHSAVLLVAISVLAFGIAQLAPGTFVDEMRMNPQISAATIDSLQVKYGLNRPLLIQYARWIGSIANGDFGFSLTYNMPVGKLLWTRLGNTFLLGAAAMFLAWGVAVPLGICIALRPQRWMDRSSSAISTLLLGTPELALAMSFMLIAAHFSTLPTGGMTSTSQQSLWLTTADMIRHLILPSVVLALASAPIVLRHVRVAVFEAWNSPHIQTARGHGIGNARLLLRHALPTAANPLISLLGLSVAGLVSASFLIEVITGWPGLGPVFINAIFARDLHVVMAVVMLFSILLVLANLASDLLLYAIDPRMRAEC